ncbi:MAG: Ig-like domain-containing protein, partial [Chitinophagales bacterium]
PSFVIESLVYDDIENDLTNVSWTTMVTGTATTANASGTGDLVNELVSIPAGAGNSVTFTITADVPSDYTGNLVNTATVAPPSGTTDPDPTNDTDTETDTPAPEADLAITKESTDNTFELGGTVTWTLIVTNAGPSDAFNALVNDDINNTLTNISWTATTQGSASLPTNSGTGDLTNVPVTVGAGAGNSVTFTITASVPSSFTGLLYNAATVAPPAGTIDPELSDNLDDETDTPAPAVVDDLYLTPYDTTISDDVSDNDVFEPNSTFANISNPVNGTLTFQPDGTFTYNPNALFSGIDTFSYHSCLPAPNNLICDTGFVTIVVGPFATNDYEVTPHNTPFSSVVDTNDVYMAGSVFTPLFNPDNGSLILNPDGSYTYTPNTGYSGWDTFTYIVCLPVPYQILCDTAITIIAVGPAASDDLFIVPHTDMVTGSVSPNDTYPPEAIYSVIDLPPIGGLELDTITGTFVYEPPSGFSGVVTFFCAICFNPCDTAQVTIVVGPQAMDDYEVTPHATPITSNVYENDFFQEGSEFVNLDYPEHGTLVFASTGIYTYSPNPGFIGNDTFFYHVKLPAPYQQVCDTAMVVITVGPVAENDVFTTPYDTDVTSTVVNNDIYLPGSSFTAISNPVNGVAVLNADGTFTYNPIAGFTGIDTFSYEVCLPSPNQALCDQALVTIVVGPNAVDDAFETPNNTPLSSSTISNDLYPAGATQDNITNPLHGELVFSQNGSFYYSPSPGFTGIDSFSYVICLAYPYNTVCDTATVVIAVGPVAVNDTYLTPNNTDVVSNVNVNDTYPSGSSFSDISAPVNGVLSFNADGSFTYDPNVGFTGVDTFSYEVCLPAPNGGVCEVALVTIVVGPLAENDEETTPAGTPLTSTVVGNDHYPGGSVFQTLSNPSNGTILFSPNGSYTYTPNPGFSGIEVITYSVCMPDPYQSLCDTATLTIRVCQPALNAQLTSCATVSGGLIGIFDLNESYSQVTGGTAGWTLSFYTSEENAMQGLASLSNTSEYNSPNTTLWVRMENSSIGCFGVAELNLLVYGAPTILATGTDLSCSQAGDGSVQVNVLNGVAPYTFDWSGPNGFDPAAVGPLSASSHSLNNLAAGLYSVVVTDGNGCTASATTTIVAPATLQVSLDSRNDVYCPGDSTGALYISVSGGTAGYQFDWTHPAQDVEDPTALPAGTYTVTVTDQNGCTVSLTAAVLQVATPIAPVFENCPSAMQVSNDVDKCGAHLTILAPTATDNCVQVSVVQTTGLSTGALFPVGTTVQTYVATDQDGNSTICSFTVTVMDMQAPTAVCQDLTLDLSVNGTVSLTGTQLDGGSSDNCTSGSDLSISPGLLTYNCSQIGDHNVVVTVTDTAGNASNCVATVTILDSQAPVVSCPAPLTVSNCSAGVPNVLAGILANDNCGIASITQSPAAGLLFGNLSGTTTSITVTVTDNAGNSAVCQVPVTVLDQVNPVFLNCPTSMVMVGTDPDQCSAKVNWTPPVATDDCQLVSVTQVTGPASGSVFTAACTAVPTTITYLATDQSGNTSTCTFEVVVMDTQKPAFDADITMPGNITVESNQIPTNCVFHGNGTCLPLTTADVNDNCTPAGDIIISFNEVNNQNPASGSCAAYTIVRTWTLTDCAGNTRQHTQVITVQDSQAPVALCKPWTVTLDDFGNASITAANIDNGSYDDSPNSVLTYQVSQSSFDCSDLGANLVVLTVSDPCGNTATCTAEVTVLEGNIKCNPEYDVTGSDPCVCLNNATNSENGQYAEFAQVLAQAGQVWVVAENAGLYQTNSPVPPAAPVLIPIGTVLTNGTVDGVDNNNNGVIDEAGEAVYYSIRGIHVDGVGFTATFRNADGRQITLGNRCFYPNAYFTNLNDPFCLNTEPFTIGVAAENGAAGTVGNVTINGVPSTVFDAGALGEGFYTVMATFDAGANQPYRTINGVPIDGTLEEAMADPGCVDKITKVVQVVGTPTTVVCNDLIHVALDESCQYSLHPDDVLEGTYFCFDDYTVEIDRTLPFGNGPWVPANLTASDIGRTYAYRLTHAISGNLCSGEVLVEDKLAPALVCPPSLTIACSESTAPTYTGTVQVTDCDQYEVVVDDAITNFGQCDNPRAQIIRTFFVVDDSGNQSFCAHTITIAPFNLADVVFPADITVNCESTYLNANGTAPSVTGAPSINGASIVGSALCGAQVSMTDEFFEGCGGTFTILRTWKVLNNCAPLGAGNPVSYTQRIQVQDLGGPQFSCPPAVTVSVDAQNCCATAPLPDMVISEGCSGILNLTAKVTGNDPLTGNVISFTVPGSLSDFPGNNYWNADTLAVFGLTQCMPEGVYQVLYTAEDQCGNLSSCQFEMTIEDLVPPALACDEFTQVALAADGTALVNAGTFDNGSLDNCGPVFFKARRMNSNDCQTDTLFHDEVKFCCSDLSDTVSVILRVYDASPASGSIGFDAHLGNYNECMVNVLVEDKIKPICTAPANVTVSCEAFDPSLWAYETATGQDNCCMDTITYSVAYNQFDTLCNKGTITRRWT